MEIIWAIFLASHTNMEIRGKRREKNHSKGCVENRVNSCETLFGRYLFVRVFVCIYVCIYECVCVFVCLYVCVCMFVCMYSCMYVCKYACINASIYVCIYVYAFLRIYASIFLQSPKRIQSTTIHIFEMGCQLYLAYAHTFICGMYML